MKLTSHLYDNTKGTTMLTQLLWYLVKCFGFFLSIRYPIDEFFLRQYYFGNTIFFSLLAVKAFVLVNNSTLRSNKPPYCFELNHISRGGGDRGSKPPASRTLQSRLPPLFSWLPPFCPFSIAKYYAMLRNFPLFMPLPALLELPPPALSSPASRTPPAPYSPGIPPPCPPPTCFVTTLKATIAWLHHF